MLRKRFVSEAFQGALGLCEGRFPTLVGGQFFKDGRGKLVLLPLGESGGGFEGLLEALWSWLTPA